MASLFVDGIIIHQINVKKGFLFVFYRYNRQAVVTYCVKK